MSEITIHIKSGQNKWEINIEPSKNIEDLKSEISKISEIPIENQRLIYSGKILKNELSIESYKIADGHSIHLVKSAGKKQATAAAAAQGTDGSESVGGGVGAEATTGNESNVPSNFATGSNSAFNPLADLTGARYAGYGLNLPSADSFGPDGGLNNMPSQDDILHMMENPMMQSQMNEMLSNPQMVDFLIQQNPQLRAMGPRAREILTSPFMRQMMTNPQMIRQSMDMQRMMSGAGLGAGNANDFGFPMPGDSSPSSSTTTTANDNNNTDTQNNSSQASSAAPVNPFASMFGNLPPPNPELLSQMMFGGAGAGAGASPSSQVDNRPPEEKYEQQLRQLNDMGFFEFDRNVAALRRSGGSVQGALDALLNGDI